MNAAFLLLTTAWLAGAGPDPACCEDGWSCPCDDGGFDGWCCDDGGWGPGYDFCCAPAPERRKEHCLKRLFRHFHHEKAPCAPPCYAAPCFQPYYQTAYAAADNCWDCRDGSCGERHGCLARLKRHFHHKERCLTPEEPPCWQPTCPSVTCYQQPCEISFSRKHCHRPHCGLFHHHKARTPAPCCPLCQAPCADCCPVCSDGCCGPFDGWSGGGCTDCDCGTEYGGPSYGLKPKAAPAAKPGAKPEKIGNPKEPPKGEDDED